MNLFNFKNSNILKPLLAITFWGMSFVATKIALEELNPLTIIELRLALALCVIIPIAVYTKRNFSLNIKTHGTILLLSLVAVFHLWIQFTGLKYTTATNTGWIIGTSPVFIAFLGWVFFKEKITFQKLSGIIIAFLGLLLLINKGDITKINFISNKGDFLVLASAFTWSIYSIINKKITVNYSPLMTILYSFAIMLIIILPFLINQTTIEQIAHLNSMTWYAVLFLGLFCSGVAYILWAQSLKNMEAAKVGAFLYIEPFVTVLTAWIILNEKITYLNLLAGIIITFGVVIVNKS